MDFAVKPGEKYSNSLKYLLINSKQKKCDLIPAGSTEQLNEFVSELEGMFPSLEISVFEPLSLKEEIHLIWPQIIFELNKKFSFARSWFSRARLIFEDDVLNIKMESKLACKKAGDDRIIIFLKNRLLSYLGQEIEINICNGDFLTDIPEEMSKPTPVPGKEKNNQLKQRNFKRTATKKSRSKDENIVYGRKIAPDVTHALQEIRTEKKSVIIKGEVFDKEVINTRNGKCILILYLTNKRDSITVKLFLDSLSDLSASVASGDWLKIRGQVKMDRYSNELTVMARDMMKIEPEKRQDQAAKKRAELHLHSKMSAMDSVADLEAVIETADSWGHPAVAITDHGVVQSFPEAFNLAAKKDIRIIYGMEAYLVDDGEPIIINPVDKKITETEFVVFDLETTGLNPAVHQIIEIGAVRMKDGSVVDSFSSFVKADGQIPENITKITSITDDMLQGAPDIEQVLDEFMNFTGESVLVAHNLSFDLGFIENNLRKFKKPLVDNPALDTLQLSRALVSDLKSYRLDKLAARFNKDLTQHHRALDDARATAEIFLELIKLSGQKDVDNLTEINQLTAEIDFKKLYPAHVTLLVKNQQGLRNLFKLVSSSHVKNFHRVPRILKSELLENRKGLLIGSACESGHFFKAVLQGKPEEELIKLARDYDYLEIQPLGNNQFLVKKGEVESPEELQEINKKIYQIGKKTGIPVIAAGDVHFIEPEDSIYRQILMEGQGFDDAHDQAPLYFRTTEEMLAEFSYFDKKIAEELVIENPLKIVNQIEDIEIISDKLYPPVLEGAEEKIREISYQTAEQIYGSPLPELVSSRLEKELDSIINNGFAVIYLTSRKLVKKSLDDGYLVGSRGSVGSSLVATMTDITEVNPLPPHYLCPECKYSEFITDNTAGVGADLADKKCPECNTVLIKDGFDIPFEVFLGFKGDKVPDIDLNFSGEYQLEVHKYTEKLFGKDHVFRAGTISTIANRTAFGFVKGHLDENNREVRKAEINRLISGCTGVKKTTGQHPGGQIIVPEDLEIYQFTPVQRPANDKESDVLTTHFDFHSIEDNLLKLDILGHDNPTILKILEDLTGVEPQSIPLDDRDTMSIFSSTEALGSQFDEIGIELGTLGIPEFGTGFARQILKETKPETIDDLVRIIGLSHGTDVWLNNAQELVAKKKKKLKEIICNRDDIMNYLIKKGVEPVDAFWIMEGVRKGRGLTPEQESKMKAQDVPGWYIDSCKKIKYMFPKAHAAAYVVMAYRIAYFKVHYPREFYTVYFTIKAADFDAQLCCRDKESLLQTKRELENKEKRTAKESSTLVVVDMVLEALLRGVKFRHVDLYKSAPTSFILTEEGLLPPLISLEGLGSSAAESIIESRQKGNFRSIEELVDRTGISKTVVEVMQEHGTIADLPESSQLSLF